MAYLAMRGCCHANGVARLHGRVSRHACSTCSFPGWPEARGSRRPRHQRRARAHLAFGAGQQALERRPTAATARGWATWRAAAKAVEGALRRNRSGTTAAEARKTLVDYVRQRLERQRRERNVPEAMIQAARHVLDPNVLTLGFARRFAEYKRPNLLLDRPRAFRRDPPQCRAARCRSSSPARPIPTTTAARR